MTRLYRALIYTVGAALTAWRLSWRYPELQIHVIASNVSLPVLTLLIKAGSQDLVALQDEMREAAGTALLKREMEDT